MQDPAEDDQAQPSEEGNQESASQPIRITDEDLVPDVDLAEFAAVPNVSPVDDSQSEPPTLPQSPAERWLQSLRNFPGCGLLEAFGWIVAFVVIQIVFVAVLASVLIVYHYGPDNLPRTHEENQKALDAILQNYPGLMAGVPLGLTWLILIPGGWFRQSPKMSLKLNFAPPSVAQCLLVISMIVPLGLVADASYVRFTPVFFEILELFPAPVAAFFRSIDLEAALAPLKILPFPVLLFVIAVMPAIGEEFLFRGLIGRGLVNRYGVYVGVTIASLLFALVHMYPPHVVAILPVGFVIHLVYLNTRSYWMPMLFHFINNTLAAWALKYGGSDNGVQEENPLWYAFAGGAYVIAALFVLYSIRTRYRVPSAGGKPTESGADSPRPQFVPVMGAEAPPPALGIERVHATGTWPIVVAGAAFVVLLAEAALLVWA